MCFDSFFNDMISYTGLFYLPFRLKHSDSVCFSRQLRLLVADTRREEECNTQVCVTFNGIVTADTVCNSKSNFMLHVSNPTFKFCFTRYKNNNALYHFDCFITTRKMI